MKEAVAIRYSEDKIQQWEAFVARPDVCFATFLNSRDFLNYHPKNRFEDHSLMFYDNKENLIAVIPACQIQEDGKKILYSHKGSTFGGIVILKRHMNACDVQSILMAMEAYCISQNFKGVFLKLTPDIFTEVSTDLLQYLLFYNHYNSYTEASTYIDFNKYNPEILSNFEQGKRTNVNNCKKAMLDFKILQANDEIEVFYNLLCENLLKYHTTPVHSLKELIEFKENRLKNIVQFYGVFKESCMIAGGMTFNFANVKMLHTQYLCASSEYAKLSPMTFLYYSIIEQAKADGYEGVSWGTSTEQHGEILNFGLIASKEAYGSSHSLNRTYYKYFEEVKK